MRPYKSGSTKQEFKPEKTKAMLNSIFKMDIKQTSQSLHGINVKLGSHESELKSWREVFLYLWLNPRGRSPNVGVHG